MHLPSPRVCEMLTSCFRIAQRDAAKQRREEKLQMQREGRAAETRERVTEMREKDKATMDMFKALAKERFG